MSEEFEEDVAELIATDPENYIGMRRLQHIHDMREWFLDKGAEVDELVAEGVISQSGADTILRRTLKRYILTVKSLPNDDGVWEKYWTEAELGVQYVYPPSGAQEQTQQIPHVGLQSIMETPDPMTFTWTIPREPPASTMGAHPGGAIEQVTTTEQIPFKILEEAYSKVNEYLKEIGIEIEFSTEQQAQGTPEDIAPVEEMLKANTERFEKALELVDNEEVEV